VTVAVFPSVSMTSKLTSDVGSQGIETTGSSICGVVSVEPERLSRPSP